MWHVAMDAHVNRSHTLPVWLCVVKSWSRWEHVSCRSNIKLLCQVLSPGSSLWLLISVWSWGDRSELWASAAPLPLDWLLSSLPSHVLAVSGWTLAPELVWLDSACIKHVGHFHCRGPLSQIVTLARVEKEIQSQISQTSSYAATSAVVLQLTNFSRNPAETSRNSITRQRTAAATGSSAACLDHSWHQSAECGRGSAAVSPAVNWCVAVTWRRSYKDADASFTVPASESAHRQLIRVCFYSLTHRDLYSTTNKQREQDSQMIHTSHMELRRQSRFIQLVSNLVSADIYLVIEFVT